jgi:hypothetical protein
MTAVFVVARNPEPASTLPYLLWVPVPGGPLVLKAAEPWPRTAKVYCHRAAPADWPADAEVLEEVPVRSCLRRGVAIDLVLDRPRQNRSQLVFTRLPGQGGREAIFWQTARTTAKARPGVRVPRRRAAGHTVLEILVDGSLAYTLAELACLPRAAVVVEDRSWQLVRGGYRLPLVEPGAGGEHLVKAVGLQGLVDLGHQLGLPRPQDRPRSQPGPPAQALGRPASSSARFRSPSTNTSWANAARHRVTLRCRTPPPAPRSPCQR